MLTPVCQYIYLQIICDRIACTAVAVAVALSWACATDVAVACAWAVACTAMAVAVVLVWACAAVVALSWDWAVAVMLAWVCAVPGPRVRTIITAGSDKTTIKAMIMRMIRPGRRDLEGEAIFKPPILSCCSKLYVMFLWSCQIYPFMALQSVRRDGKIRYLNSKISKSVNRTFLIAREYHKNR